MRNVHTREIDAPADVLALLLDGLSGPGDRLWPSPAWPPLRFDRPLGVGATGGHGPIRYEVTEYEFGRRLRFAFDPELGIDGFHEFRVEELPADRTRLVHEGEGHLRGSMRWKWPLVVRWLHDALIEDAFDNAEHLATGRVRTPARWSPWVRTLRVVASPRPRPVPVPEASRTGFGPADLADGYAVRLAPGAPTSPVTWAEAMFTDVPIWVRTAMAARQFAVRLVGIDRGDRSAFHPTQIDPTEAQLGADANHLVFRASVLVDERTVTFVTLARAHNLRGRAYLGLIRHIHPVVVRSLLRRANLKLATS